VTNEQHAASPGYVMIVPHIHQKDMELTASDPAVKHIADLTEKKRILATSREGDGELFGKSHALVAEDVEEESRAALL